MAAVDITVAMLVRDQCVCLNMRKAGHALTNAYDAALAPAGLRLTSSRYSHIWEHSAFLPSRTSG